MRRREFLGAIGGAAAMPFAARAAAGLRHERPVLSGAFSGDGSRIVTASADCIARLWDVRFETIRTGDLVAEVCTRLLPGRTACTRNDMRLAGYPDEKPPIDAATRSTKWGKGPALDAREV